MDRSDNWKNLLYYLATGKNIGETRCLCDLCLDGEDHGSDRVRSA